LQWLPKARATRAMAKGTAKGMAPSGAAPGGAGVQDRALLERIALPANRSLTIEYSRKAP